jgi:hypothetical protein
MYLYLYHIEIYIFASYHVLLRGLLLLDVGLGVQQSPLRVGRQQKGVGAEHELGRVLRHRDSGTSEKEERGAYGWGWLDVYSRGLWHVKEVL